ncbi:MAG: hypothetical protein ABIF92_01210, partial [archaeon]
MTIIEMTTQVLAFASRSGRLDIFLMIGVALLILAVELLLFFVPGVSVSTLLIALSCLKFGFVPSLAVVIPPIIIAHFILLKNPSIAIGDTIAMIVMILFGVNAGPWLIDTVGWGFYGALFGVVKWGTMILVALLYGGNVTKRVQNIFLEPVFNFFIFWKLRFLFG